jgi:hypothetical protein
MTELSGGRAPTELGAGVLIGVALSAAVFGSLAWAGAYRIDTMGGAFAMVVPALAAVNAAFVEELVVRGVLFRLYEQVLGTAWALVAVALVFGLLHLINPQATLWGALAIAATGGLLLAAAYVNTRRLWLPIGIHFAWDFFESGIFGVPQAGRVSILSANRHLQWSVRNGSSADDGLVVRSACRRIRRVSAAI